MRHRPRARRRGRAADAAVGALHRAFFATPYRPTGLSTAARAIVRLVDELGWLDAIVVESAARTTERRRPTARPARSRSAAAAVLERGAELLECTGGDRRICTRRWRDARAALEARARRDAIASCRDACTGGELAATLDERTPMLLASLDPSFRAQELELRRLADRRATSSWPPPPSDAAGSSGCSAASPTGSPGTLAAAAGARGAHVERHSVWLHNSLRGAVALALAVLVADLHRRAALLLGRARHALGAALERAQHRAERVARPARHGRRVRRRRGAARADRHQHDAAVAAAARRGPARRVRAGGDLLRRRPGRVHADAGDPLQHHPARRLAGRACCGSRTSRSAARSASWSGCCSGRAAPAAALRQALAGGLQRQRALPRRRGRFGMGRCDPGRRGRGRPDGRGELARRRRPPGGSTTPSAATSPSAAPSRRRSPR